MPFGRKYLGELSKGEFTEVITGLRDLHSCPPRGRGREDKEETGERPLGMLSPWLRDIPNIRVINVDGLAYCPACWHPLIFIEEKSTRYDPDEWQVMRHLARLTSSHAMFFLDGKDKAKVWLYPA